MESELMPAEDICQNDKETDNMEDNLQIENEAKLYEIIQVKEKHGLLM